MMKHKWAPIKTQAILKNVESVFKSANIGLLSLNAYTAIHTMSGFIAHYDIGGFRAEYQDIRDLINNLLRSGDTQDPGRYTRDTWFVNEYGLPYCQSKVDLYTGLRELAIRYQPSIEMHFKLVQSQEELQKAAVLAERNGYIIVKK